MKNQSAYMDNIVNVRIDTLDGEEYFEASIDGYPDFVEYDIEASTAKSKLIKRFTKSMRSQFTGYSRVS
jgi:hypothetical protein